MKKTNILIAALAVMTTASVAQAQININFDGKLKPQSMHDIFADNHHLVPAGADAITPVPVQAISNEMPKALHNALTAYYVAQPKIKALVAGYYLGKGNADAAARLSDKTTRVLAANGSVVVIRDDSQEWINDAALAARVEAIAFPNGQQKSVLGLIGAGGALINAATNNAAWNAVGDAVAAASEAVTHQYYTNGPGAGQQQGWDDMPD